VKDKEIEQLGFEREGWQKDLESVRNEVHARDLTIENLWNQITEKLWEIDLHKKNLSVQKEQTSQVNDEIRILHEQSDKLREDMREKDKSAESLKAELRSKQELILKL